MAYHRLGQGERARVCFEQAARALAELEPDDWQQGVGWQQLRREAEKLLPRPAQP
jgi:hypothetical protein